ncbi:MAG: hypothetical protein ACPLW6_07960 [Desulfurella sp.]|jgi:hypothetical protein|uniref:Uncharacterized protein n=1 Tax=Desulfurella multipotens TaxID=79269 RepID=A0A1G6LSJ7_9BACT|nr:MULTISPECIES: hypothetical protein [Desulfurella]AHF97914.1 hypothetical protein DESACE_04635 [Desulfurella acetivorans A63]PMP92931.1 MAG: hypothetical protein C0173_01585 [Desulfurella sp.]SDC46268.1 hypothetical protein SAMN05660835_00891 [Desulfurella multipotens]
MNHEIDPKWFGSLFGIIAFIVSCLIFVYLSSDFFYSTLKIIVTSISFYMFGIVVATIFNYISNSDKSNQNSI